MSIVELMQCISWCTKTTKFISNALPRTFGWPVFAFNCISISELVTYLMVCTKAFSSQSSNTIKDILVVEQSFVAAAVLDSLCTSNCNDSNFSLTIALQFSPFFDDTYRHGDISFSLLYNQTKQLLCSLLHHFNIKFSQK